MIIDFSDVEEKEIPGFKGGEGAFRTKLVSGEGSCKFMRGHLEEGCSIGYHTHEGNSETVFILSGTGSVLYDGTEYPLSAGQCHHCPAGHSHSLRGKGPEGLTFYACVIEQ